MVKEVKPECKCQQIMLVNASNLAVYPIKTVLKTLFDIQKVETVNHADDCITIFKERVLKRCCTTAFKFVLCDLNLPNLAEMTKQINELTQQRINVCHLKDDFKCVIVGMKEPNVG